MEGQTGRRVVVGIILIVVGVGLLVVQLLEGVGRAGWLLFLSALFLVGHIYRQTYGFLVAGGILAGVGVGQIGQEVLELGSGAGSVGLGLGFISIYLIDRFNRDGAPWWPLIPGGILVVTGVGDLGEPFVGVMDFVWPAALIIIGLFLLLGLGRRGRRDEDHM